MHLILHLVADLAPSPARPASNPRTSGSVQWMSWMVPRTYQAVPCHCKVNETTTRNSPSHHGAGLSRSVIGLHLPENVAREKPPTLCVLDPTSRFGSSHWLSPTNRRAVKEAFRLARRPLSHHHKGGIGSGRVRLEMRF